MTFLSSYCQITGFHLLFYLILTTTLLITLYYFYFTDLKTEAQ